MRGTRGEKELEGGRDPHHRREHKRVAERDVLRAAERAVWGARVPSLLTVVRELPVDAGLEQLVVFRGGLAEPHAAKERDKGGVGLVPEGGR